MAEIKLSDIPAVRVQQVQSMVRNFEITPGQGRLLLEKVAPPPDPVNHPSHYKSGGLEAIDVIEAFKFNYHVGQVFKYIARHELKGRMLEDLKKARWYLDREIARLEQK